MSQTGEFITPTLEQIYQSTRPRSPERTSMGEVYGHPFKFLRYPIYNNPNYAPEQSVVGSLRTILDHPKRGIGITDILVANDELLPLDAVLERIWDLPLDTNLVQQVYERLSTSRILSGIKVCAGVEVITGFDAPQRVSRASIIYPACYENGESPFVAPAYVGMQMALLYLQNFK